MYREKVRVKEILKISLPTVIAMTLTGMYSVVDGLFIGRAAGDTGLAAINIAWPITALVTAMGFAIGSAGSVLLSNYQGRGSTEEAEHTYETTVTLLLLSGIVSTLLLVVIYPFVLRGLGASGDVYPQALAYSEVIVKGSLFQILGVGILPVLRNRNKSMQAMCIMILGILVNVVLNYYLMFHKDLGIRGAAYGTVWAQGVVALAAMVLLYRERGSLPHIRLPGATVKRILFMGISGFGVPLAPSIVLIFTNWQCLIYGGKTAVACYAVISYIVFPVQSMLAGMGDGVQPLISRFCGEGKYEEMQQVRNIAYRIVLLLGGVAAITVLLLSNKISVWFGLSEAAAVSFATGIRISMFSFFFIGIARMNVAYLNATLQTRAAIVMTYTESLLVAPILLYLLPVFFKINGVWGLYR
ncbi:MAG: MATE family efflux transporter [Lachnospiraceae bacterium]